MKLIPTNDNSNTLYSKQFDENYHSTKDGAINETLYKHIYPALKFHEDKNHIVILDICYGLGYNTLLTVLELIKLGKSAKIISPEFDLELIQSLNQFEYPKEFEVLRKIIHQLSTTQSYKDSQFEIKIIIGDAREYLKSSQENFDIVYQDPFSLQKNPLLWTREYFAQIKNVLKNDGILTTYSTATNARMGMYENGFFIYQNSSKFIRAGTLASLTPINGYEMIDMRLKKERNKEAKSLRDMEFS